MCGKLVLYVGQTGSPKEREWGHRSSCNTCSSRHIPFDDWELVVLEEVKDLNKVQEREHHYYTLLKPFYNEYSPIKSVEKRRKSKKTYRDNHKEQIKAYREKNREHYNEYMRNYKMTVKLRNESVLCASGSG